MIAEEIVLAVRAVKYASRDLKDFGWPANGLEKGDEMLLLCACQPNFLRGSVQDACLHAAVTRFSTSVTVHLTRLRLLSEPCL